MSYAYHLWGALTLLMLQTNNISYTHNSHLFASCTCNQQHPLPCHQNQSKAATHICSEKKEWCIQESCAHQSEWQKYVPHAVRALIAAGTIAAAYRNWDFITQLAHTAVEHKVTTLAILVSIASSIE